MPGLGGTTNNYEILAQLASGGMAEIFLARVTAVAGVERHVVLKRILPAFRDDPAMVAMFLDEARLQAQLRHPNIAQLHDVGMLGTSYFYTMEYVHGETVQSLMAKAVMKGESIPLSHIMTIAGGISAALHHAHTRVGADRKRLDIIHRDVSPANIMITFDGSVKLLDFGVAKSSGRMTQTRAGVVKGKVAYLSPEQIGEKTIDGRSDLFSLGICLYEMLTLHGLFARSSDLASLAAIVQEKPPPPSSFRRDIPPQIDQLIMTALSKDPTARFGSADQMHQAVEAAATSAKLAMSAGALGRYLAQMFGNRAEPWLAASPFGLASGDVPVTVIGDIIEPTMAAPVDQIHDEAFERKALEVDRRISQVRKVPQFDDGELAFENNATGKLPQMQPPPNSDFELDSEATSIVSPRYELLTPTPMLVPSSGPRAQVPPSGPQVPPSGPQVPPSGPQVPPSGPQVPPSGPQVRPSFPPGAQVPPSGPQVPPNDPLMQSGGGLMQSGGRPIPDQARPLAQRPSQSPHANWEPSTYRTRQAQPHHKKAKEWNVPRVVIVGAFLVAVIVAIWIAVT